MRRRDLFAGIGALSVMPSTTWADANNPTFLSAARHSDGSYHLCGLDERGTVLFNLPIPDRGHAAAAHPERPEAVAFARRPGRFAMIVDCARGREVAILSPPVDRHFYGHGVFSSDGSILFTTENDLETLDGRIGLWDATQGYSRIGDIPSGGIGPHDIGRLPGSETLVVANGGIATHPDSGRTPLNLATMRSNLTYLDADQGPRDVVELDPVFRQNSIRHLSIRDDGLVAAGMQWNGPEFEYPPLVITHALGAEADLLEAPSDIQRRMQGYVGSIAFVHGSDLVGATSPRGGLVHLFDAQTGEFHSHFHAVDVCGIATAPSGTAMVTTGTGVVGQLVGAELASPQTTEWMWDNHLVVVQAI
ncbi:MAG: DUF1513 domain-containing protein [Pseudomonadota bacterium]